MDSCVFAGIADDFAVLSLSSVNSAFAVVVFRNEDPLPAFPH
jgi:hypothetical protein